MKKLYAKGYFAMFILVCCVGILILLYGFHAKDNCIQGAELLVLCQDLVQVKMRFSSS